LISRRSASLAASLGSLVLLGATLGAAGCGPSCKRVADARAAFRRRPPAASAHGELLLPLALGNRLLAQVVTRLPPRPFTLPGLGPLASAIGQLEARATRAKLVPASRGRLGIALGVAVTLDGKPALDLELNTAIAPRIETLAGGKRALVLSLDSQSLRGLKPRIAPGGARRLAKLVRGKLPRMLRGMLSEARVAALLRSAIAAAGQNAYRWLPASMRQRLVKQRVAIPLPDLPLKKAIPETRSKPAPHLAVALHLDLPVRAGLPKGPSPLPLSADRPQLRLSGSAVAELGNWAMEQGLIPARYDKKLRPKKRGGVRPMLDWIAADARPLKVHVFRSASPCTHLRLGARADVTLIRGARYGAPPPRLRLRIGQRKVEQVEGSIWIKLGVFFDQLWSKNLTKTQERAAGLTLTRGGRRISLRLDAAKLTPAELALSFAIVVGRVERPKNAALGVAATSQSGQ
jgi:hypothetical protein